MKSHTEIRFEEAIEYYLVQNSGYHKGDKAKFNAELGLFPEYIIDFIKESQPEAWKGLVDLQGKEAENTVLESLCKELALKGAIYVLRQGFKCFGKTFRLAYFSPNTGMNPEILKDYQKNRLTVTRQIHFSTKNPDLSLDAVIALNGLPIATLELKNPLTNQNVKHAIKQYKEDRDPREPIFKFKERALVHFAVDPDLCYMTTKLADKETSFLPFNLGDGFGAGNPVSKDGKYKTAYLWDEVLQRDSLLDILARFVHLKVEEKQVKTDEGIRTIRKESLIFPRYHQLDAVRKLIANAKTKGPGHNYLIQHSAGSGKSNSIAWLAHRLASLHNDQDQKVFDAVVVITDRRVLDRQLQDTIYQFDHKQGVVQKIDEDTQQLAKALSGGVPIIISTIQKFPFITQAISTLEKKGEKVAISTKGRRFAVIVDEAHSSQSGETAMELKKVLNHDGISEAIADQISDDIDEELSVEAKESLIREMMKRAKQPNISFFAFTATPKFKTLAVFNEPGETGRAPFHLYSQRQAIEEGFILDVLANYTTYKAYYGLIKSVEDDPKVPKKEAAKALARFMSLHPHNISQKVEVIVEHFRTFTRHKIGGRAKAMVVTASRLHAVRYKLAFDQYIKEKGYKDVKSLVAFSGKVVDPDAPEVEYTEVKMNHGIKESELPERFATEEYQVLLVADKYQTGFDQPLLHTMYVDKRLSGVQAVQTLSRLNRIAPGKEDTFVLDFVNDRDEIYRSFKPYYEATPIGNLPDPHKLYQLQHEIKEFRVFSEDQVTAYCQIWFKSKKEPSIFDHQQLNAILDKAVEGFNQLKDANKELFQNKIDSFCKLYTFLAQIIPFQDSDLEKYYTFLRFLSLKTSNKNGTNVFKLGDEVVLKFYRLQKISEGSIALNKGSADPVKGPTETGTRSEKGETINLSMLIDKLNERFGTDFTKADELFFDQITETALKNEKLIEAGKANTAHNFKQVFEKIVEGLFIERMEGNEQIFSKVMNDRQFKDVAIQHLADQVYTKIQESIKSDAK